MEQSAWGRVVESPATKVAWLAKGLCSANGIALNSAEDNVSVGERGRYQGIADRCHRALLASAKVLLYNLSGYPDSLTRGLRHPAVERRAQDGIGLSHTEKR